MDDVKKRIKIKFQNGLTFKNDFKAILGEFIDEYQFEESEAPDIIIFGPYGKDFPLKGNYIRVGYFCECIKPDLSLCDFAFGIPPEELITDTNYCRIQWHGLNPENLKRGLTENEIDKIVSHRKKFCNFLFSNPVSYREEFFKRLQKYKQIDAPGKSMRNMQSIDNLYSGNFWERKRQFINEYKFTIAFENYSFPGYQTEKLYDSMLTNGVPIYYGDPCVSEIFNTSSFINARDFLNTKRTKFIKQIEKITLASVSDCAPSYKDRLDRRITRKLKTLCRRGKMYYETNYYSFEPLIEHIIKIDNDDTLYAEYLRNPYLKNNTLPFVKSTDFWKSIFSSVKNAQ